MTKKGNFESHHMGFTCTRICRPCLTELRKSAARARPGVTAVDRVSRDETTDSVLTHGFPRHFAESTDAGSAILHDFDLARRNFRYCSTKLKIDDPRFCGDENSQPSANSVGTPLTTTEDGVLAWPVPMEEAAGFAESMRARAGLKRRQRAADSEGKNCSMKRIARCNDLLDISRIPAIPLMRSGLSGCLDDLDFGFCEVSVPNAPVPICLASPVHFPEKVLTGSNSSTSLASTCCTADAEAAGDGELLDGSLKSTGSGRQSPGPYPLCILDSPTAV